MMNPSKQQKLRRLQELLASGFSLESGPIALFLVDPLEPKSWDQIDGEYDFDSAIRAGLTQDPETGRWPSRDSETGLLMKSRNHDTWDKTVEGEKKMGYDIYKGKDGRDYSRRIGEGTVYREDMYGNERTAEPERVPYSELNFRNIVEKQEYWDSLPEKYGEGVRYRQNFLDELTRPINIDAHNDIIEFSDTYMENMGEFLPKSHPAHRKKNYRFSSKSPATQTSWKDLLKDRKDIENKPLFFASMMDEGGARIGEAEKLVAGEGGHKKVVTTRGPIKLPISGWGWFGLDRIGERIDEFEEKGYLPKGFGSKIMPITEHQNEKGEFVVTADFYSLDDVITAKNAYMKAGQDNVDGYAKGAKIDLSPKARDFFTIVSYNYGETGARKMMKYFKDKGLLEDDKFLTKEPGSYKQVYRNALRRMQAADMIKGEGFFK